jgi:hypothetical protein
VATLAESVLNAANVLLLVCVNGSESPLAFDRVALEVRDLSREGRRLLMDVDGLLLEFRAITHREPPATTSDDIKDYRCGTVKSLFCVNA